MTQTHEAELTQLARLILEDAVDEKATDVHLTPTATGLCLRYRVDGRLRVVREFPATLRNTLPAVLADMSGHVEQAEGRVPLDGAAFRLSTVPTAYGPNTVLRLLDPGTAVRGLDDLGMAEDVLSAWRGLLAGPGLLVVTGPSGCGKTTTLYASIAALAGPTRNTLTVEDPIECSLDWTVQTAVTPDLPIPRALRGVLTQDPDVVLCGEVREAESARLLCQMGSTGMLVLTAMHTTDAAEVLTRLIGIGMPAVLVASAVRGVLAQRLVRRVCERCGESRPLRPAERAAMAEHGVEAPRRATVRQGTGCSDCGGSGYRGRTAIFHLLRPSDDLQPLLAMVERGEATVESVRARVSGSLLQSALEAAVRGETTVEEGLAIL